ncbi:tRNA (adenosine(37)-N6)-threonylcarbamoyltransferase complex ATPase subunit type 1 TsaE [Daejeonella sp.]|uniref:tRNA (adenosine(37)-N6)-threonylcarbamoyltransferase complex ATPase subunit type 1 TsaE n=1 Tax=Daejeonella sp. TaxID=2805397 RepID=UPI0039833771
MRDLYCDVEFLIRDIDELPGAGKRLLEFFPDEKIFFFEGIMGAGKTTLIKALCAELKVKDTASSPTYSIVNEYNYPDGKIFHFDFFRIKSEIEAYDLGFEEYLYSGNYCFIEWPEKIHGLWPESYIKVVIANADDQLRSITVTKI